tara:strand:- start:265 stop:1581 length:1317 start_codon:yes stop_codon:yes gene_type:complete
MPEIIISQNLDTSFYLQHIIILGSIILINAYLTAFQLSLAHLRSSNFEELSLENIKQHWGISRLLKGGEKTNIAITSTKTLCILALSIESYHLLDLLFTHLAPGNIAPQLPLIILSLLFSLFLQQIFAILIPEAIATMAPKKTILNSFHIPLAAYFICWPIQVFFNAFRKVINNRLDLSNEADTFTSVDVKRLLHSTANLDKEVSRIVDTIVDKALNLDELVVQDVLLPRNQVIFLDIEDDLRTNLRVAQSNGHTRYPLCNGELDNCLGIIHTKDIFRYRGKIEHIKLNKIMRAFTSFKLDEPLASVLQKLLRQRIHMALVKDEFGGTMGVVTLEGILEELVGEIQDEFDSEDESIIEINDVTFRAEGLTPIHELEEKLNVKIANEDISTVSGLITAEIGRIPNKKEKIIINNLEFTIDEVEETRIIYTRIRILPDLN